MKDGTKVSIIYIIAWIPCFFSMIWLSSFIGMVYSPSDLTLPFVAIFFTLAFALLLSYFHPRTKHWRKVYCEFEENYLYEKEAE